ncbi:LLM class flavin-dependent oxidoreductase [Nocardioides alkalitolerans]|uniref:LLM class flavin-dependent oxidoreductase n=1 Tax=Nocardioides alkalitolerans TaxID=281714 RepID=UPI0003FF9453|nr:LLM class flavin-dependent oxidoreductase [Nocardioides alkalitolerans]
MKFGILLTSVYDASVPAARQKAEHEELVRTSEELGFDLMVAGQHFLGSELRYFQPVPWLTHMGGVAPTMRTATGIVLLSMVNPVEVAEQMATLDVLTDGRAIFGVGLGYSPHEFAAFGVEKGTKVARFEESLRLVKALWSGEQVDIEGEYFSVSGAQPSVRPVQPGGIPIWIGGQAAGAVRRAARMGDAWYSPPFPTHDELVDLRRLFLDTRAEAGLALDGDFPVRRELLIAPTREAGMEAALERYRARYETYKKWGLSGENTPVGDGSELRADIENRFVLGTPAECVDQLGALGEKIGMSHFVYKPHWPGLAHRDAMAQLEEFGTKVLPELAA